MQNLRKTLLLVLCLALLCASALGCANNIVGEGSSPGVGDSSESAGGSAAGGSAADPAEVADGEPQYGGTLTAYIQDGNMEPPSPDPADGQTIVTHWLDFICQRLAIGDFEKYGPRGTGEYDFITLEFIPEQYVKGQLLESWEFLPDKAVWHVRPGVMWSPTEEQISRGLMDGPREVVAADIVDWAEYFSTTSYGGTFNSIIKSIKAVDKYTIDVEWNGDAKPVTMMYSIFLKAECQITPPETRAAGADKWENIIGTGPFMLKEYVTGSHMTFVKNPNYWETTTIDGKEYQIPFVDEVVCPIIADETTRVSALRTGVLDYCRDIPVTYWENLRETNSELNCKQFASVYNKCLHVRANEGPTSDVNVRRALMIGTDIQQFIELAGTGGIEVPLNQWPFFTGDSSLYIPVEELDARSAELFSYNPELAKKMLADAGYPDGLTIQIDVESVPDQIDRAALLKDQWAKIGVNLEIISNDSTTQWANFFGREYHDILLHQFGIGNPVSAMTHFTSTGYLNIANWYNERFDELLAAAAGETDLQKRHDMLVEAGLIWLNECPVIPLVSPVAGHYWQPWLKNFYGEYNMNNMSNTEAYARMWIDQEMKAEMLG